MQQLINVWTGLDLRRQIIVIGATIAMFFAIISMSRIVSAPNMTLLYAGLEANAAGEVVRVLEQRGVAYDVRGGAIFVDVNHRDELRMTLASEGLPANSTNGYELLDSLSGFGTTSQMFDAAYWRAKEGELARTIVANPHVSMARVHIASTGSNPFQRGVKPKASVSVTSSGGTLSSAQAKAIRYLVASAVSGLASEDVVVIDSDGTVLGANEESAPVIAGNDRAELLRDRVKRILEARVGIGNSVVEVSVDTVTESEAIREKSFDPQGRVAISTDTEQRTNSSSGASGGEVTVASNLPDENGGGAGNSASNNNESRERINYEVSETEREIIRSPGAIKRLTVAVLVNDISSKDANDETTFSPRPAEELETLRELVASAVGFDENRGDIITIKSMALQSISPAGTVAEGSFLSGIHIDFMSMIQMAVLAIVTLVLGLFVVRPLLSKELNTISSDNPQGLPPPPDDGGNNTALPSIPDIMANSEISDGSSGGESSTQLAELPTFPIGGAAPADPVDRLKSMIGERQEETVEILRGWLEEKEETTS